MANGWGGRRDGSGRKPNAITIARKAIIANKIETAEEAFAFQEAILHDETQALLNRQAAAVWIYEQIMGKAPQHMTVGQGDLQDWRDRVRSESATPEQADRTIARIRRLAELDVSDDAVWQEIERVVAK